ncbi:MAG: cytochrome c biogenesis protein ResB [Microcoleaceae cyanobacterium]
MIDRTLRFLGSIRFAVPLLSAIAGILIWATFYESKVGSATVQQAVYKSPWFGGLMFLLALNLGISALTRYPWRGARKMGFALTHLGLIVIIAGSAAVIHLGVEGMLLVGTDSSPNSQIRVEGEVLEFMDSTGTVQRQDIGIRPNGSVWPAQAGELTLLRYSDNTIKTVEFVEAGSVENPAIHLSLTSQRMGQTLERWLAAAPMGYDQISIGPAELELIQVQSQDELERLLQPPAKTQENLWGTLEATVPGEAQSLSIDLRAVLGSRQPNSEQSTQQLTAADDHFTIQVVNFWPDFRLNSENQPTTVSDELNNPVVQLQVSSSQGVERWFLFGQKDLNPVRTVVRGEPISGLEVRYQVKPQTAEDYFHVLVADGGDLFYTANSSKGFKSGTLTIGEPVSPGWADFQINVEEVIPHAQIRREILPVPGSSVEGTPALLVKTEAGTEAWLSWGEPTTITESTDDGQTQEIFAAFSPKILQLPFAVNLDDFIVERNEGSESVAMWTSQIRILDGSTGEISPRRVWMNHPTWYRGWKLAQASWNPGDLQQSTLQVKREPAWVTGLTWSGSALVILGIAVMFYGPAVAKGMKGMKVKSEEIEQSEEQPQPTPHPEVSEVPSGELVA